jgi:hypothetical protein
VRRLATNAVRERWRAFRSAFHYAPCWRIAHTEDLILEQGCRILAERKSQFDETVVNALP